MIRFIIFLLLFCFWLILIVCVYCHEISGFLSWQCRSRNPKQMEGLLPCWYICLREMVYFTIVICRQCVGVCFLVWTVWNLAGPNILWLRIWHCCRRCCEYELLGVQDELIVRTFADISNICCHVFSVLFESCLILF